MTVKNIKEAEARIRKAMEPPATQAGPTFAPSIQKMRQTAKGKRLPTAR